jgi:hypothetical protein
MTPRRVLSILSSLVLSAFLGGTEAGILKPVAKDCLLGGCSLSKRTDYSGFSLLNETTLYWTGGSEVASQIQYLSTDPLL